MKKNNSDAPALKIERAKHHIDDLNTRIDGFLAEQPFKTIISRHKKPGKRVLRVEENKAIPLEFSLIIGDAIHNLRSALDILIFELIGSIAERPDAVQFPFARSDGKPFENALTIRQIALAGEDVVKAIRELKPYGNGNELLYGLHRLDIDDKHKLIITAGVAAEITADDARKLDPMLGVFTGPGVLSFRNTKGGVLFTLPTSGRNRKERRSKRVVQEETESQPTFNIAFGVSTVFEGQLVIDTLTGLVGEVERSIYTIRLASK